MKTKILLTLLFLFCEALAWGQATLVKDIYPLSNSAGISSMASIGDKVIFNANNSVNGNELWISDGTEAGTFMLKDINVGDRSKSSFPETFREYNNLVTFVANDGTERKLYRTDGTDKGTFQIWDRSYYSPIPQFFYGDLILDNEVYWVTDYPKETITLIQKDFNGPGVKDILGETLKTEKLSINIPFQGTPLSYCINKFGNKWIFEAYDAKGNISLYIADLTAKKVTKLPIENKAVNFGIAQRITFIISQTTANGLLAFFAYDDGSNGIELWKTDGTVVGTKMVKNTAPGGISSMYQLSGANVNNGIVFWANDGKNGTELWFSDGTDAGTNLIKEFSPGSGGASYYSLKNLANDNRPYIHNTLSTELWRTDGTTEGTKFVTRVSFQDQLSYPDGLFLKKEDYLYCLNNVALSIGNRNPVFEIVKIDTKTDIVTVLGRIDNHSWGEVFTIAGKNLFYEGYSPNTGIELWKFPLCSHTTKINTPNGTSFCPGSSVSIAGEGNGATSPFTYKWKQGTTDAGTAAILAVTKAGTYTVEVTDKEGCTVSASVDITQTNNLPVSITGANSFCAGQNTTLTANATGGVSPYTYQWKQNSTNVGTNTNTYTATAAGSYSVGVTDSKGCTGTSAAYSVTQKPSPNVTVSTSRTPALLTGETVVLSVPTASGQTYQWSKDGTAISGATNNSYTVSGAGSYTVTVPGGGCTATSSAVMVSIILANEPLTEEVGLRVSPNPTVNQAKIVLQLAQSAAANVYVLDASGRRVRMWESAGKATRHEVMLDMRSVAAGSYVVQAEAEGQVFTEKLVKQ